MTNLNEFVDLEGYEEIYKINRNGIVLSVKTGRQLSSYLDKNGYVLVRLNKNGEGKHCRLHRLLAIMFIYNNDKINKTQINHKDGNKSNNNLDNLEWCTPRENNKHARDTGLNPILKGEDAGGAVFSDVEISSIREELQANIISQKQISKKYGISEGHLSSIKSGTYRGGSRILTDRNKFNRGELNKQHVLKDQDVYDILDALYNKVSRKELQKKYGVSKNLILLIAQGKTRQHVKHPHYVYEKSTKGTKLKPEKVKSMHLDRKNGASYNELCEKYGVSNSTVQKVLSGDLWGEIYEELNKE